jgi:hypothetical protein
MWGWRPGATTRGADLKSGNAAFPAKFRNSATVPAERMAGRRVQPALVAGVHPVGRPV